jgi:hypothetical protein
MDMREVTKVEFYAALYLDPRDIMPRIVNNKWPYRSDWSTQHSGALFGRTIGDTNGKNTYYLVKTGA